MQVATFVLAFGEGLAGLMLYPNLTFSDIVEFWKGAIDISHYLLPFLGVEAWVAL